MSNAVALSSSSPLPKAISFFFGQSDGNEGADEIVSGLIAQSQKMTAAAMQMAEKYV